MWLRQRPCCCLVRHFAYCVTRPCTFWRRELRDVDLLFRCAITHVLDVTRRPFCVHICPPWEISSLPTGLSWSVIRVIHRDVLHVYVCTRSWFVRRNGDNSMSGNTPHHHFSNWNVPLVRFIYIAMGREEGGWKWMGNEASSPPDSPLITLRASLLVQRGGGGGEGATLPNPCNVKCRREEGNKPLAAVQISPASLFFPLSTSLSLSLRLDSFWLFNITQYAPIASVTVVVINHVWQNGIVYERRRATHTHTHTVRRKLVT